MVAGMQIELNTYANDACRLAYSYIHNFIQLTQVLLDRDDSELVDLLRTKDFTVAAVTLRNKARYTPHILLGISMPPPRNLDTKSDRDLVTSAGAGRRGHACDRGQACGRRVRSPGGCAADGPTHHTYIGHA